MEDTVTTVTVVMGIIGVFEVILGVVQIRLARKLKVKVNQDLAKKATKEELREVEDSIDPTLRRLVPEVLQAMAELYMNRSSADQQGSSGADSRKAIMLGSTDITEADQQESSGADSR